MKRLLGLLISGALVAGSGGAALAQQTHPQDTTSGAKQGTKNTGTDKTNAAKSTTKKTKKTTKKSVTKGTTDTGKGTGTTGEKTPTTNPTK
jgi:hypothetical protein